MTYFLEGNPSLEPAQSIRNPFVCLKLYGNRILALFIFALAMYVRRTGNKFKLGFMLLWSNFCILGYLKKHTWEQYLENLYSGGQCWQAVVLRNKRGVYSVAVPANYPSRFIIPANSAVLQTRGITRFHLFPWNCSVEQSKKRGGGSFYCTLHCHE